VTLVRARSLLTAVVVIGSTLALAACTESVTAPSGSAPYSQTDIRAGTGGTAIVGGVATVHYTGWLYDQAAADNKGLQFDSSVGGEPFSFAVGRGQVIGGWDQGVPGMRVGGVRRLVIPPSLGYGGTRNGPIPPNATLVFDIELLEVE
jgi:FKBP-type peptidyl-prolyl cis-trans isomerase FkpA